MRQGFSLPQSCLSRRRKLFNSPRIIPMKKINILSDELTEAYPKRRFCAPKRFATGSLLLVSLLMGSCAKAPLPPPPTPHVTVACPTACTVPEYLEYTGNLTANITVEVKAQVSGILTKQAFVEGQ